MYSFKHKLQKFLPSFVYIVLSENELVRYR